MTAPDVVESEFVEEILDDPDPSSEAPADAPEAPADTAAQPPEPIPAQPTNRDDKGRFKKPRTALEGPGASQPSLAPDAPAVIPAVDGAVPDAPLPDAPTPWTFNADKQPYHLEGAVRGDFGEGVKGLYIPDQHVELIQGLIAEGIAHRGSWRQREAELQGQIEKPSKERLEQWRTADPEVVKAKTFNAAILNLLNQGPEAVAAWLDDYQRNMPVLIAQAEKDVLAAERDALRSERDAELEDRESAALRPKIETTLQNVVRELAARDIYKQVDARAIYERVIGDSLDQVVYEVAAKDRAQGLEPGETLVGRSSGGDLFIVNWGKIEREFAYQAQFHKPVTSPATQQAAAKNKAATAPAAVAPPTVPAAGSQTPAPSRLPIPKGKKEVQKWIESGAWKQSFD